MSPKTLLSFLLLATFSSTFISKAYGQCTYRIRLKTGTRKNSGTDAKVSLQLFDRFTNRVDIPNLQDWGIMGPGRDYYENGNLDLFEGNSHCLGGPVCMINLAQDGSGNKPGWFVDNVVVTSAASTQEQFFSVNRWLAVDEPPRTLNVVVNKCFNVNAEGGEIEQVTNM